MLHPLQVETASAANSESNNSSNSARRLKVAVVVLAAVLVGVICWSGAGANVNDIEKSNQVVSGDACASNNFDGVWDATASSPLSCQNYDHAHVTRVSGCTFNIKISAKDGNHYDLDLVMDGTNLHETQYGDLRGHVDVNSNPMELHVDNCVYAKSSTPAEPPFDFGGLSFPCQDKLLAGRIRDVVAPDIEIWRGDEKVKPTRKLEKHLRDELNFIARGWVSPRMNFIMTRQHAVALVDMKKCLVKKVFLQTKDGEVHPAVRDNEAVNNPYTKCSAFFWKLWHKIEHSGHKESLFELEEQVPMAPDATVAFVDEHGRNQVVPWLQNKGLFRKFERDLYTRHKQASYMDKETNTKKLAFVYPSHLVVIAEPDECRVSRIFVPTPDGRINPLV